MMSNKQSIQSLASLEALDNGAYRDAITAYQATGPADEPLDSIWRAEVALYLDRVEEAAEELNRVTGSLDRDLANRVQTIRAEIAFADKALDLARELIAPVVQSTWECGDHQGHLRSSLLTARVELRRGNAAEFLEKAREPRRLATVLGNDYYGGIIAHGRAYAFSNLGELKQAGHAFAEALHLLSKSEGLRWEAACRVLYSAHLTELGQTEEALSECDRGEKVAYELGLMGDALWARTIAAKTLLNVGRYEEIVTRLEDVLSWQRASRHMFAEIVALQLLSIAQCELERYVDAQRTADELVQMSRIANNSLALLGGESIRWWAAGRAGDPHAIDELERLVTQSESEGSEYQLAETQLYLAEIALASRPDLASQMFTAASTLRATDESVRLRHIAGRIRSRLAEGPVRIGPLGELIIDTRRGLPSFDMSMDTVRRFLAMEAVRAADGNRAEAARQLGLSRSRFHDLWLQIHGKPVRPEKTPVRPDQAEKI